MKVGILTYHYVYNEGAIWQAYTLCKILRSIFPDERVEIIDYRYAPKYFYFSGMVPSKRRKLYEKQLIGLLSNKKIVSASLTGLSRHITEKYDVVIVGSDIIWQYDFKTIPWSQLREVLSNFPLKSGYSYTTTYRTLRDLKNWFVKAMIKIKQEKLVQLPVPNAYWLPEGFDCLRISYAASIGYSDPNVPKKHKVWMRENFSRFRLISVRDDNTKTFLNNIDSLLGERACKVPDPTWLFKEHLPDGRSILSEEGLDIEKPIAGVLYPLGNRYGRIIHEFLVEELGALGYQVVSVIDRNNKADADLASKPRAILDWWAIIKELDFFVTVRTHPNIAALLYQTPFVNLDITAASKFSNSSKSADMLADFSMEDLCLYRDEQICKEKIVKLVKSAKNRKWDWGSVTQEIRRKRDTANNYIDRIKKVIYENPI